MTCTTYGVNELQAYKFAVILSDYRGKILLSRHRERATWEAQGGHIEPGETPLAAAERELYEESGALHYDMAPLCDYWAEDEGVQQGAGGMVFVAHIWELGAMPQSEIAEVREFDELPANLTYPEITQVLFARKWADRAKRILYGTGNPAKLEAMRRRLVGLDIRIVGLGELDARIPTVEEDGCTPLENAQKKAWSYYQTFHMPVFSCDSGLYIDGIPDELQPGVHVRTVDGVYLTDEEMLQHYSGLAKRYGTLRARYRNAICLILDETHVYSAMESGMESEEFLIVETPHAVRKAGFPLDSVAVDLRSGKYYYDLEETELDRVAVEDGFLEFFRRI